MAPETDPYAWGWDAYTSVQEALDGALSDTALYDKLCALERKCVGVAQRTQVIDEMAINLLDDQDNIEGAIALFNRLRKLADARSEASMVAFVGGALMRLTGRLPSPARRKRTRNSLRLSKLRRQKPVPRTGVTGGLRPLDSSRRSGPTGNVSVALTFFWRGVVCRLEQKPLPDAFVDIWRRSEASLRDPERAAQFHAEVLRRLGAERESDRAHAACAVVCRLLAPDSQLDEAFWMRLYPAP